MASHNNKLLQDLSVVHRLCFAARSLPVGIPHYWQIVRDFSLKGKEDGLLSSDECRVFVENLLMLQEGAFDSDKKLTRELVKINKTDPKRPEKIGIVLISPNQFCIFCGSKLYVRADRSSLAVIYDHELGTLPAIHYTRYCRKKSCSFQQHYGYYTKGDTDNVIYNQDALDLPYFMASRETGFTLNLLRRFDSDCLIGQISYKQAAEIYNNYNKYDAVDQMDRYKHICHGFREIYIITLATCVNLN